MLILLAAAAGFAAGPLRGAQPNDASYIDNFTGKPRLLVLTDIGNEPDDQMSMVRLLLYSNELDLEGLVATTSTWQKTRVQPETIRKVIAAYAQVRPNLLKHAPGWPEAQQLDALVSSGQPAFGMAAVGADKLSQGARALIAAADRTDERPLWISIWGGANTLAQALLQVRATRSPEALATFVAKLRVYSISDQDDAGPWIRREFPLLPYIVKPSPPNSLEYGYASWTGISGDVFYRNCMGADGSLVTNQWLEQNIRAKGPLGHAYPHFAYIMEGDTPSFLGLLDNGLNAFRNPGWGGWGGRYLYQQPYGETRAIWTQGGDADSRETSQDEVTGIDGRKYFSDQATVWRWRGAFQHDFAARMDWTVKPYTAANHNPLAIVNGVEGSSPIYLSTRVGETIELEADKSRDPDGNALSFSWFQYAEAGYVPGQGMAAIEIADPQASNARIKVTGACRPNWLHSNKDCAVGVAHVILALTDNGSPSLTSYRRVVLTVTSNP